MRTSDREMGLNSSALYCLAPRPTIAAMGAKPQSAAIGIAPSFFALDSGDGERLPSGVCEEIVPLEGGELPEWVRLLPPGPAIEAVDGRRWRMPDAAAVVRATNAWPLELQVDFNHSALRAAPAGGESPAAGWIKEARVAASGAIEGRIEWTALGAERLKGKLWKYISPDFHAPGKVVRRITGAGLVNRPALAQDPLMAGEEASMNEEILKRLLAALGLAEGASEEEIASAAESVARRAASPPLEQFVPRAQYDSLSERVRELESAEAARGEESRQAEAEAAVEAAMRDGKVPPALKEYWTGVCSEEGGLERFKTFLASAPAIPGAASGPSGASGDPPKRAGGSAGSGHTDEDLAVAEQFGLSAEFLSEHAGGRQHG